MNKSTTLTKDNIEFLVQEAVRHGHNFSYRVDKDARPFYVADDVVRAAHDVLYWLKPIPKKTFLSIVPDDMTLFWIRCLEIQSNPAEYSHHFNSLDINPSPFG